MRYYLISCFLIRLSHISSLLSVDQLPGAAAGLHGDTRGGGGHAASGRGTREQLDRLCAHLAGRPRVPLRVHELGEEVPRLDGGDYFDMS